jgi:hypothetical protein
MELIVKQGGQAERKDWDSEAGSYTFQDVTDTLSRYLKWPISLEEGVVIRDIFALAKTLDENIRQVFSPWADLFIEEALQPPQNPLTDVEYLEFYRVICIEEGCDAMVSFPDFHGIGTDEIPCSVWPCPAYEYAHLPVKLKRDLEIYEGRAPAKFVIPSVAFTLMDIFQGLFWEISFSGPPDKRNNFWKDLEKDDA